MKAEGAVGYCSAATHARFQEATGAMHWPPTRIDIGFHDPAFAEFHDSLFHHRRLSAALDEPPSIAAKQNQPQPAEAW